MTEQIANSERTAKIAADRIVNYWLERGYPNVTAEIVTGQAKGGYIYEVRTNLKNGLPPGVLVVRLANDDDGAHG